MIKRFLKRFKKEKLSTRIKIEYNGSFEIESITIGKGKPERGAPSEEVFIIKLGKRV